MILDGLPSIAGPVFGDSYPPEKTPLMELEHPEFPAAHLGPLKSPKSCALPSVEISI